MPLRPIHRLASLLALPLSLALAGCAASAARSASAPSTASSPAPSSEERDAVVAATRALFDGMRSRDTSRLRALLAPELVIVAAVVDGAGDARIRRSTTADFLRSVATGTEELRERLWDPVVHVDGPIATLWAPYDFHLGERFSHCGHDAFQLARTDHGWIITGLTYTVRRSPCAGPR